MDEQIVYSIAEVSEALGVTYRTLHYYEEKMNLQINRDGAGNRIYRDSDLDMLSRIVDLKKKGMSLDGIKALLQESGIVKEDESKDLIVIDENAMKLKEFFMGEIQASIAKVVQEQLQETNEKMDQILQENEQLRETIANFTRQSEEHYQKLDGQLTAWREKAEKKEEKVPFFKKLWG